MDNPLLFSLVEAFLKLTMMVMIGLYFIFSNTIMSSLAKFGNGAEVMVEINKRILNPIFMACFFISGFAALYFLFAGTGLMSVAGAIFFFGTTAVTVVFNVPLNDKLRDASKDLQPQVWDEYLNKWVIWNHLRSISAVIAGFLLVL